MSIWASIGTADVVALTNDSDEANYRGEGEPDVIVDVATALPWQNLIRLAVFGRVPGAGADHDFLLTPEAARLLAYYLTRAATASEKGI